MKKENILHKILIAVIAAAICFSTVLISASATTTNIDINEDGTVDVRDSTHLQMYLAGYFDLSASVLQKADADKSGSVDIGDVTRIQMLLAGYTFDENTTQQPTSNPSTTPTQDFSKYVDEIIRLTNNERTKAGVSTLSKRTELCEIAQVRSVEASESFSHIRPNGKSFPSLAKEKGVSFKIIAENLACGQNTPEQAVKDWINSPTHKDNMLDSRYTGIGVACYQKGNTLYWVQVFVG